MLGIIALLSYTAAVVFSPLAYPGYNWMAQAVSDLSAANAPSLRLWNQLSILYNVCALVCGMMVCAGIKNRAYRTYGIFAGIAFGMMLVGALGMNVVPKAYFGIVERFSVFAAVGYNAVLGIELFRTDFN